MTRISKGDDIFAKTKKGEKIFNSVFYQLQLVKMFGNGLNCWLVSKAKKFNCVKNFSNSITFLHGGSYVFV